MLNQNQNIIIITAQSGTSSWTREYLNPSSWVRMFGEGLIGGYKEKMEALRRVDHGIAIWLKDLDYYVKRMRTAADASRYIDVAIYLDHLNKRLTAVKEATQEIKKLTEKDILPFELEHREELPVEGLFSEAGFWDDFKRGLVSRTLENEFRAARKMAVKKMIDKAATLVEEIKLYLKELGRTRAKGDIEGYLKVLFEIGLKQNKFKSEFIPVYNKYLKPLVDEVKSQQLKEREERKELEKELALKKEQEKPVPVSPPPSVSVPTSPAGKEPIRRIKHIDDLIKAEEEPAPTPGFITEPSKLGLEFGKSPLQPAPQLKEIPSPEPAGMETKPEGEIKPEDETKSKPARGRRPGKSSKPKKSEEIPEVKKSEVENLVIKNSHQKFVNELVKVAKQDDPYLISMMLLKYAEQIEDADLTSSLKLLAVAEGILG